MYPDSGYKTTHAQSVCTGPFSRGEGPGDEANMIPAELNKWLSIFVAETRKVNGQPYPLTSIHLLLVGLQQHVCSMDKENAPNLFAKNDPAFQTLHQTMDSVYRKLRTSGVGAQKRCTETFTKEEENTLWKCGVLGVNNPKRLLFAVFFGKLLLEGR